MNPQVLSCYLAATGMLAGIVGFFAGYILGRLS
jgi:hypothetical protein